MMNANSKMPAVQAVLVCAIASALLSAVSARAATDKPEYLDTSLPVERRTRDLISLTGLDGIVRARRQGPRGVGTRPAMGELLTGDSAQGVGFIVDGTSTKACRGRAVDASSGQPACPGGPGKEQVRSWHLAY